MRKIEGETIIVPIAAGVGDLEDELYTVNETGNYILSLMDGKRTLKDIVKAMMSDYDADEETLTADVIGFVTELSRRKIQVEVR
jgi:methyltransferase-like protein